MDIIKIKILRYDPEHPENRGFAEYLVKRNSNSTVLEVLLQIYEEQDQSLAFSYGCRVINCGLCAVDIDRKPRYSCITKIEDGMEIGPLKKLPLIKDLVFDRKPFFDHLGNLQIFIIREKDPQELPEIIRQPNEHTILMSCRECFGCMSSCPKYDPIDTSFGGPLSFVKLAQLHYDCRDSLDRAGQARKLGILSCSDCRGCSCISGIPLKKLVIDTFLKILKGIGR